MCGRTWPQPSVTDGMPWTVSQFVDERIRHWVHFGAVLAFEIAFSILGMLVVAAFSRAREKAPAMRISRDATHSTANTYSTVELRISATSGDFPSMIFAMRDSPVAIATYWFEPA